MRSQSWNLHQLPGMTSEFEQQLVQLGIKTTAQLLQRSRTAQDRQALARQLHQPLRYVNKWVALADLARVPSVGCQYNGLLLHAGVISVAQLAQTALGTLHARIRRFYVATLSRSDLCPDPGQVAVWVREAQQIAPL
jgi:predicted flap endonuclease-1-like 5' DNA nuclease